MWLRNRLTRRQKHLPLRQMRNNLHHIPPPFHLRTNPLGIGLAVCLCHNADRQLRITNLPPLSSALLELFVMGTVAKISPTNSYGYGPASYLRIDFRYPKHATAVKEALEGTEHFGIPLEIYYDKL
jgi:hypothetical protein